MRPLLNVSGVKEGVNITAGSEVLHTTDASVGEVVEPQSMRESPLKQLPVELDCLSPRRTPSLVPSLAWPRPPTDCMAFGGRRW
jgi:hypothetical protein